jgi:hypothetical protein
MTAPYGLLRDPNEMLQESLQKGLLQPPPAPQAPPPPPPEPTFREKLATGTRDVLNRVRETLVPTPQGFEGLLTPEEIAGERPNLLQHFIRAPEAPNYTQRLGSLVERKAASETMRQREAMLASRQQVSAMFPPPANETPQEAIGRLKEMYAAYAANGDTEMLQRVGEVLKSIGGEATQASLQITDAGDRLIYTDPRTGAIIREVKKGARLEDAPTKEETDKIARAERDSSIQLERAMAGDFQASKTVQDAGQITRAVQTIYSLLPLDSPQSDLGIIIALTKAYDPGSVAREGEVKLTIGAASAFDKLKIFVDRWNKGRKLTPAMKEQVRELLDELIAGNEQIVAPIQADFGERVRRYNVGRSFPIDSAAVAPSPHRGVPNRNTPFSLLPPAAEDPASVIDQLLMPRGLLPGATPRVP